MTVKKPIPCSLYDIPGIQEWLDEMALQGLFLKEFTRRNDQAVFTLGDPKPVRYRLDPMGKNVNKDRERETPYAQMGWEFVDYIREMFYIFSCEDPDAPELYTDPQSLAMAMDGLLRRNIRRVVLWILFIWLILAFPLFWSFPFALKELVLWESPRKMVVLCLYPILMVICCVILAFQVRKLLGIRNRLAQGLPLKAKRRWNRPRWYVVWALSCLPIIWFPNLLPNVAWEVYSLEEAEPARPWPTLSQLEAAGPRPLETNPAPHGYAKQNSSWLAPVQQFISSSWEVRFSSDPRTYEYCTNVRYVQARSLPSAGLVCRVVLDDAAKTLKDWTKWNGYYHITGSADFTPRDWPGLDRLEVAEYRQCGQDAWTFAARRGTDILVVGYIGPTPWEDCLPLFLEALDTP